MRICLVEDAAVAGLEPLTLTRPVFDLRLGAGTLQTKVERAFTVGTVPEHRGSVIRPHLAALQRERDPQAAVNDREWLGRGPVIVANGRWVPPANFKPPELTVPSWAFATACSPTPSSALGRLSGWGHTTWTLGSKT